MQKLAVLGTAHLSLGHPAYQEFKKVLKLIIDDCNTETILEEWSITQTTSAACAVAKELGLPWTNIGTPDLPEFQTFDPVIKALGFDPFDLASVRVARYGPLQAQSSREKAMVKNIMSCLTSSINSGLVIIGANHLHSMMEQLSNSYVVEGFSWIPGL